MKTLLMDQQDWETLLDRAVSGILSDDEAQRLNTLLKGDSDLLDDYIRYVDMHGSLYQEPLLAVAGGSDTMIDFETIKSLKAKKGNLTFWKRTAVAASAVALLAFSLNLWQIIPGPSSDDPGRAEYIGIMTSMQTKNDSSGHFVGEGLQRGLFKLGAGKAQLRLDNGVELSMRGPVEFDVVGLDHISLISGRVTANVPPQAIGFRIDTPDMEVVDLGTEFALKVDSSGQSRLHVLEGEVEARLISTVDNESVPLVIAKNRLGELAHNPSYLERNYDPESFAPSPLRDRRIEATSGMIHSLQDAPRDLRHGRFKHDYIMLFPERLDFSLPDSLPVNLRNPGTYRILHGDAEEAYLRTASEKRKEREKLVHSSLLQGEIPASTVVNSYLVHFDASDKQEKNHKAKGRVRFNNQILGVIIHGPNLNESDAIVGNADTIYENHYSRRTENDLIRISLDRHQVYLDFEINGFIDQVRIIVEADPIATDYVLNKD